MTALRFVCGVLGHWMVASAGHGAGFGAVRLYGAGGVVNLDARTVQRDGSEAQSLEEAIAPYVDAGIPTDAMAHSFGELFTLITAGALPISSGERALEALAVVYACLEAAQIGRPVAVADVLSGAAHVYEDSIEAARAAWPATPDIAARTS